MPDLKVGHYFDVGTQRDNGHALRESEVPVVGARGWTHLLSECRVKSG